MSHNAIMAITGEKSREDCGSSCRMGASIGSVIWISTADTGSVPWGDTKDMSVRPRIAMVSAQVRSRTNVWRKSTGYPPSALDFS